MTDSPNGRNPFFPEEPDNYGRGDSQYQPNYDPQYQPRYDLRHEAQYEGQYEGQDEPQYEEIPVGRHGSKRRRRGGVAAPILGALAVLALVAGAGWYVARDTTSPTSQNEPLTVTTDDSPTPTDELSTPVTTPSRTPSATPSATPSKSPSKTPKATPSRTTAAPSRDGTRSPQPSVKPTTSATPTKKPTRKPSAPSSGSAEAQVLQLTNQERAKAGCGPLRTNSALTEAAEAHASDMVLNHYFDHNSQDGRSPFDRMKAAGFTGGSMAENIAVGYKSAGAVMEGWMNSEGHRKNILNCSYTMIGIGYDSGQVKPEWGSGSWVQDFGG